MTDNATRRGLKAEYKDSPEEAGVYRIVNSRNGRGLLGSTTNLRSIRNRLEFARSTNSPGALDLRLKGAIEEDGIDAFSFEVLETLDSAPESTAGTLRTDLATLEKLWREKLGPDLLY